MNPSYKENYMPWIQSDSIKHTKKATSSSKKKQWEEVANSVLKKTGDEGKAVKIANGVIKKGKKK